MIPGFKWALLVAAIVAAVGVAVDQWSAALDGQAALIASLVVATLAAVAKAIELWATKPLPPPPGAAMARVGPPLLNRWWNG